MPALHPSFRRTPPATALTPGVTADPVASFLECHDRIRTFLAGLGRLAALDDLADPRAPDAARACARYFSIGLPLHGQDEDESLSPRLRLVATDDVLDALDRMTQDHREMDGGLPMLLAQLEGVIAGDPPAPEALRASHRWLEALMDAHMAMEEAIIFPAARGLEAAELSAIAAEMRGRR